MTEKKLDYWRQRWYDQGLSEEYATLMIEKYGEIRDDAGYYIPGKMEEWIENNPENYNRMQEIEEIWHKKRTK
jgi:hypothetical protein